MKYWKIRMLLFGYADHPNKGILTANVDVGMPLKVPFWGFLISNGSTNILVDNGVNDAAFVDGKMWGLAAVSGEKMVREALAQVGLSTGDIDTVVYSHLHVDHAGNCHLFPGARHIFQLDEWRELLDPLPWTKFNGDYYQPIIPALQKMECCKIEGDLELYDGIKIYKTPGHTSGSLALEVATQAGNYIIAGDTVNLFQNMYSEINEMQTLSGETIKITPAPQYGPSLPSAVIYNCYDWARSIDKIKSLLRDRSFLLPGHEPSLLGKTFPPELRP